MQGRTRWRGGGARAWWRGRRGARGWGASGGVGPRDPTRAARSSPALASRSQPPSLEMRTQEMLVNECTSLARHRRFVCKNIYWISFLICIEKST